MTQPLDRGAQIPQVGDLDTETGEFWREHTFEMGRGEDNLSAYEPNRMFLNLDGERFLDCSFGSGCDIDADSRSVIAADFNRDGGTDLLVGSVGGGPLRLFANERLDDNHSVRIKLQGKKANRQGIGSRLVVTVDGKRIVRDLFPANGCLGQGPAEVMVGVGKHERIDSLEIRWPHGEQQSFRDLPVDGVVTVPEGGSEYQFTVYSEAYHAEPTKQKYASIDAPRYVASAECKLSGDERVLGFRRDDETRAYPIRYLQSHQLCHDEIAGESILVSYCPPAGAGTAFLRSVKLGGESVKLQFAVAGMIDSVGYTVLRDTKTKSFWNPLTGQCIAGKLKGAKLRSVSLVSTSWEQWKHFSPRTDVLAAPHSAYPSVVRDNSNSGAKHASGVSTSCDPDAFGLGVRGATQQLFVPLESLAAFQGGLVSGRLDGDAVVVFYDSATETASCYYTNTELTEGLKFSQAKSSAGRYVADDGSVFDLFGLCRSGPMQGQRLHAIADSTLTRWFAWNKTYPKAFVVKKK